MNTPPTGAPGVAPPSGYTTSPDSMSSAGRNISDAATDAQQGAVKDIKNTELTEKEFGVKHTQWFAGYSAAIEQLGAGSDAMCATLETFAGHLGGAGTDYSTVDTSTSQSLGAVY